MAGRRREYTRTRTLLAQACARIMAEEGVGDFRAAKRKAAQRLGMTVHVFMPSNQEIQDALVEYQRLFLSDVHADLQMKLRLEAMESMRYFKQFKPRLVGSVLNGTAAIGNDIQLHIFADSIEEVQLFLMDREIPVKFGSRRFRISNGEFVECPTFAFGAGDINFDVAVFPVSSEREAPKSPVDGRPMRRADIQEMELLVCKSLVIVDR